ncbi:MAG: hypothetical protein ACLQVD_20720 [Capsulimonadaceae bacterium]
MRSLAARRCRSRVPVLLACVIAFAGQPAAHSQTTTPTYVLWANSSGALSLWNYSVTAGTYTQNAYGPYPGWTASSIAAGPDGLARVLWVNSGGAASIWSVADTGAFTQSTFGPFPGWSAQALSVGDDGTTHVLWTSTGGAASVWNYNTTSGGFTQNTYGPFPGWTAKAIADGPDSMTRVLWTNAAGAASVWSLDNSAGTYTECTSGPYNNWTATALSVGIDDTTHVLWSNTDGTAAVWNLDVDTGTMTQNVFEGYGGLTPTSIADGADGITRLAWDDADGAVSIWNLNASSGSVTQQAFGPYSGWSATELAAGGPLTTGGAFGPNVLVFTPSMSPASIQSQINAVYTTQQSNQFGPERYAFLFQPGTYNVDIPVGYYTQVLGLGQSPDDTSINGYVQCLSGPLSGNDLINFWRGAENLAVDPIDSGGTDFWAVSQASPLRRMHIKGNLQLDDYQESSGGFLADSVIDDDVLVYTQSQWMSRNDQWAAWGGDGGIWNIVFVGDTNTPTTGPVDGFNTIVANTPVSREKPFLTYNSGSYSVFAPTMVSGTQGSSWNPGPEAGTSIPISQFYIAQADSDSAETINAALRDGMNLLLTPGIYVLDEPIDVTRAGTVVLGLGLATLHPTAGTAAMTVADVDGVDVSGIIFDAGTVQSPYLLQVGPSGSSLSHATNPITLHDDFFRVGDDDNDDDAAQECLEINANNVIGDNFWIWRADHDAEKQVQWTGDVADDGLVVNGNNDTIYGLAVEHFEQYDTLWNGNGGQVYFYQNEVPYLIPNQSDWISNGPSGPEDGYPSYKVAAGVTSHTAMGLGMYMWFNTGIVLTNAIEAPDTAGVNFTNMVTITDAGTIDNIINGTGSSVTGNGGSAEEGTLASYP